MNAVPIARAQANRAGTIWGRGSVGFAMAYQVRPRLLHQQADSVAPVGSRFETIFLERDR